MKKGICLFIFFAILLFSSKIYSSANTTPNDDYLLTAEKMPEPAGGLKSLYKNVKYPSRAIDRKIEGKVFVMVWVDEAGKVNDAKVVKGIGEGCDEAAVSAINKTKFNPGENGGKKVKVKFALNLVFKLK